MAQMPVAFCVTPSASMFIGPAAIRPSPIKPQNYAATTPSSSFFKTCLETNSEHVLAPTPDGAAPHRSPSCNSPQRSYAPCRQRPPPIAPKDPEKMIARCFGQAHRTSPLFKDDPSCRHSSMTVGHSLHDFADPLQIFVLFSSTGT
jgi:hypothetical protein